MSFEFLTTCAGLSPERVPALHRMRENAIEVTYRTMRRNCPGLLSWALSVGYGRDLPLSRDWHVAYYKSTFEGRPCYFLVWSAFEVIFVPSD